MTFSVLAHAALSAHPAHQAPLAIDLNQPGSYWHWSIFNVSVANLMLIAVMVVIFGAALVLPFPGGKTYPAELSVSDPATGERLPFIPGLRDIPRLIPIHRIIWRSWDHPEPGPADTPGPVGSTPAAQTRP